MNTFDEADALLFYPFDGDFGEPTDRILSDKFVTARKEHQCHQCLGNIEIGTRYRQMKAVFCDQFRVYFWCNDCCAAMAQVFGSDDPDKGWDALEARFALRYTR